LFPCGNGSLIYSITPENHGVIEMKTEKTRLELLEEFYSAPLDALFDETVVAAIRGCDKTTLQRDRWAGGGIPFLKLKRAVRYRKCDVLHWLNQYSPQTSTSDPSSLCS